MTVLELLEGFHPADASDSEREAVENLLAGLREYPFDRECGPRAAAISADYRSGTPNDDADLMIAATAQVYDVALGTGDPDHFGHIENRLC